MIIYTDGSYRPSKNQGGIGLVYILEDGSIKKFSKMFKDCTNNIMELMAIYVALQSVTPCENLEIVSDSEYAIGCLTKPWSPKKNVELILKIKMQLEKTQEKVTNPIVFTHTKGHSTNIYNNMADELATKASDLYDET